MPLATTTLVSNTAVPTRTMLFLHGVLGTKSNWRGIAKRFVDARPDWAAVLVDLREHGDSLGLPGEPTVDQCAKDLLEIDAAAPIRGALGHSFGGKVAMRWAELTNDPVDELWVIDSSPSRRAGAALQARAVLTILHDAIRLHPDGFSDRAEFTRFVMDRGEREPIAEWLAMNLVRLPNGRRAIRLDLRRIEALLVDYGETDTWAALEPSPKIAEVHMVVGGRSPVVDETDRNRLENLSVSNHNLHFDCIVESGHWIHVDALPQLLNLLLKLY